MTAVSPEDVIEATARPILEIGRAWMADPATGERAVSLGLAPPFGFWVLGRAGVLGEVDADLAAGAIGFMAPEAVRRYWESRPDDLSPSAIHAHYSEAAAQWGRSTFAALDDDDLRELTALASRIAAAAEPSVGLLFAGWRAQDLPTEPRAAATIALNVLREHRGGAHLSASQAAGIGPLGAIIAAPDQVRGGVAGASRFGWVEPYPDPEPEKRTQAESMTTTICLSAYEALDSSERRRFASLVGQVRAALNS